MICYRAMKTRPSSRPLTLIAIALTFGSGANDVTKLHPAGRRLHQRHDRQHRAAWPRPWRRSRCHWPAIPWCRSPATSPGWPGGTWVSYGFKAPRQRQTCGPEKDDRARVSVLPGHVRWAPCSPSSSCWPGFTAGWEITGSRPCAGGRSSSCSRCWRPRWARSPRWSTKWGWPPCPHHVPHRHADRPGQFAGQARPEHAAPGRRRFGVLIGLAAGAGLCGLLITTAAAASSLCYRWPR